MAKEKKYKETKKKYSRWYRKNNPEKVKEYNDKTKDHKKSRRKARDIMKKKYGASKIKNKEIDHKDGNPLNNNPSNLRIAKKHHGGGAKGNQNRKGK
jgi:hypothetical protein